MYDACVFFCLLRMPTLHADSALQLQQVNAAETAVVHQRVGPCGLDTHRESPRLDSSRTRFANRLSESTDSLRVHAVWQSRALGIREAILS